MSTPNFAFQSSGGGAQPLPSLNRKQRYWAVLELKYRTEALWTDELTFTWYVMTKTSDNALRIAQRMNDEDMTPFSFYNTAVRYVNIQQGNHMACVCLDPSVVSRYGEPEAVTVIVTNKSGEELARRTEITAAISFPNPDKWWDDEKVMSATVSKTGKPYVARRAGLIDRSKTPFALINAADYEVVQ